MSTIVDVDVYIAMNEEGDWIVTSDESKALSELGEHQGGYHARVVKISISMSPPVMTEMDKVAVPDDAGTVSVQT